MKKIHTTPYTLQCQSEPTTPRKRYGLNDEAEARHSLQHCLVKLSLPSFVLCSSLSSKNKTDTEERSSIK